MNLDPRTVVILTVLSTLFMSISLFAVARGYLAEMRGVRRWASGTLLQSIGWIFLALLGVIPSFVAELGSPLIMLGLALYFDALLAFKQPASKVRWVYVVVALNLAAIYYFLLLVPDMSARIVVASATGALLMFASARLLFLGGISKQPISHSMTGSLFAVCSVVLLVRAIYYLLWNTSPDQSAFEHNIVQDIAFLTFFLAGVVSPFTFILMCNDRYNAQARLRTQELAQKNIELEEASRVKGQFLATMSHELRTPLNGVTGFLRQLGKTRLDEKQKDFLHTIDLSAKMLLGVINDILDFSKIEAGKLTLEEVAFDLRLFLDEIIAMFSITAEGKGIELVCIVDRDVPSELIADPLRLTQILSNLLSNALKFTEQGEVVLEVKLIAATAAEATLHISVTDTGIGISEDSLGRLFQPFVQADASTTRKHGGTGLGLIIAKKLVEMMGGTISVESKVCQGTCFGIQLTLPLQASQSVQSVVAISSDFIVLIISPYPNVQRGLKEMTAVVGMDAHAVSSGVVALESVKQAAAVGRAYDSIIFDSAVKDIAAEDFATRLRSITNAGAPILLVSSHHQTDSLVCADFVYKLSKPVRFGELRDHLRMSLSGSHAGMVESKSAEAEPMPTPLTGKVVLIVDDNNINRKLVQLLVAELGGSFDLAENGLQAVDACSRRAYDLILMDVNMPVMDGLEATRRIRALESSSYRSPIVALTANALSGDRERFIASGMDDYLSKPFNEQALLLIVERLVLQQAVSLPRKPAADIAHQATENEPALDPELGVKLSFGDPDTWRLVLGLLLDELPDYAINLQKSARDLAQLSYLAHKLAGSSCYCGTPSLYRTAKQLEMDSLRADNQAVEISLHQLQLQVSRLLQLDQEGKLRHSEVVVL
jgi:two-component system sensor histidine kinase BarA